MIGPSVMNEPYCSEGMRFKADEYDNYNYYGNDNGVTFKKDFWDEEVYTDPKEFMTEDVWMIGKYDIEYSNKLRPCKAARCGEAKLEVEMSHFHCPEYFENSKKNNLRQKKYAARKPRISLTEEEQKELMKLQRK